MVVLSDMIFAYIFRNNGNIIFYLGKFTLLPGFAGSCWRCHIGGRGGSGGGGVSGGVSGGRRGGGEEGGKG